MLAAVGPCNLCKSRQKKTAQLMCQGLGTDQNGSARSLHAPFRIALAFDACQGLDQLTLPQAVIVELAHGGFSGSCRPKRNTAGTLSRGAARSVRHRDLQ